MGELALPRLVGAARFAAPYPDSSLYRTLNGLLASPLPVGTAHFAAPCPDNSLYRVLYGQLTLPRPIRTARFAAPCPDNLLYRALSGQLALPLPVRTARFAAPAARFRPSNGIRWRHHLHASRHVPNDWDGAAPPPAEGGCWRRLEVGQLSMTDGPRFRRHHWHPCSYY